MSIIISLFLRSSGASITKAKEEFTTGVMSNKNVQSFAADAAMAGARLVHVLAYF